MMPGPWPNFMSPTAECIPLLQTYASPYLIRGLTSGFLMRSPISNQQHSCFIYMWPKMLLQSQLNQGYTFMNDYNSWKRSNLLHSAENWNICHMLVIKCRETLGRYGFQSEERIFLSDSGVVPPASAQPSTHSTSWPQAETSPLRLDISPGGLQSVQGHHQPSRHPPRSQ